MCLEKGGDGPILSSNVDPAPQFWGYTVRGISSRGDMQEDEKQKLSVTKSSQGRSVGQAGDDVISLPTSAGLMWPWELTSPELASGMKRQGRGGPGERQKGDLDVGADRGWRGLPGR